MQQQTAEQFSWWNHSDVTWLDGIAPQKRCLAKV